MKELLSEYDKVERLYELYQQKMYAVAYGILHDSFQAEDAVQEAFIRLIKNRDKIKDPEDNQTKHFVIRVIQTAAIDCYRKNQREGKHFTVISEQQSEMIAEPMNPIEDMIRKMGNSEEINRMLLCLPEHYREVIIYRCLHQLSVKETAAVLEVNEAVVRKRYERAKVLLMKQMGDEYYEYKII